MVVITPETYILPPASMLKYVIFIVTSSYSTGLSGLIPSSIIHRNLKPQKKTCEGIPREP